MAARAISTATISFGLVSIPVKLYSSSETAGEIHFNQMHRKDGARLKQQLVSSRTGEVVPREEIVKGYEFSKGQYVLFNPEELKAIEATANNTIDITEFVRAEQVERLYFDKLYFLGPDKGGARAYQLLGAALRETGRVALAKYAARGRQYLVMVRPMDKGIVLEQLRYPAEVRSFAEVPIEEVALKPAELKLAVQLIEQAASEGFHPEAYQDEVRERMLALIQRKVEGEDITVTPTEEPERKIIDIMEALKASLAASGKGGAARKPARRAEGKEGEAASAKPATAPKAAAKKKAARG
jgi:DNA end-binding protein Ku